MFILHFSAWFGSSNGHRRISTSSSWIRVWIMWYIDCFLGMTWIFTKDWPIIFGGKPHWPVPSFIPITFELTVLFAAWGMTITFYTICGLWPGVENPQLDLRTTDDKFCLAFDANDVSDSDVRSFLAKQVQKK